MDNELKKATYIGINITVHIIILFSFLSLFFFLYVSRIEEAAFKEQIGNLINNNIQSVLEQQKEITAPLIQTAMPYLNILRPKTGQIEVATIKQNLLVKFSAGFTVLILIAICLSIILTLVFDCNKNVPIQEILLENTLTFIFVGIIEFLFFTKIAIHYVPAPPTLMLKTIFNTFRSAFVL